MGHGKKKNGSMTVEAAMILPLFLFVVLNMYSAINDIALHMRIQTAMHRTSLEMAKMGYAYNRLVQGQEIFESELADVGFNLFYVKNKVISYAGSSFLDRVGISGKCEGISFLQSEVTDPEYLDLKATYMMSALFLPESFENFQMTNRARMKVWTGYDNTVNSNAQDEGEIVYITQSGEVYHRSRECSYLQPRVTQVSYLQIEACRNESGNRYSACERCSGYERGDTVYITDTGERYHVSLSCSSLHRTVLAVYLTEVEGRHACSRCGNGG